MKKEKNMWTYVGKKKTVIEFEVSKKDKLRIMLRVILSLFNKNNLIFKFNTEHLIPAKKDELEKRFGIKDDNC